MRETWGTRAFFSPTLSPKSGERMGHPLLSLTTESRSFVRGGLVMTMFFFEQQFRTFSL
jgi:hypothetical protein